MNILSRVLCIFSQIEKPYGFITIHPLTAEFSELSTAILTFVSKTTNSEGNDEITYSMTVPDDPLKDGPITFNSTSSDAAGNDDFTYENNSLFILDNTAPAITITYPVEHESYNDTDLNIFEYLVDELNANASGTITYTAVSGSATDATINLDALNGELTTYTQATAPGQQGPSGFSQLLGFGLNAASVAGGLGWTPFG